MATKRVPRGTMGLVLNTAAMTDAWFAANRDTSRSIGDALATTGQWRKANAIATHRGVVCQPCKAIKYEIIGDNSTPAKDKPARSLHKPLGRSLMARTYVPKK